MPALGAYANVFNTALVILQHKGFRVWTSESETEWFVEREGWDFMADDPIQLLGLVSIYEFQRPAAYQEYWWQHQDPWAYRERFQNSARLQTRMEARLTMRRAQSPFGAHHAPVTEPATAFAPAGSAPVTRSACVTRRSNPPSAPEKKKRTTKVFRNALSQPELPVRFTSLIEREFDADSNHLSKRIPRRSNG